jgi:DMSO/TMAO reductase YedYZ heme-binding membrane subunit
MLFLVTLAIVTVLVILLQKPLKRWPVVFYLLSFGFTAVYLYTVFAETSLELWRYLLMSMQRCTIALAFLGLVMFANVFPNGSRPYILLMGLRRELSIIGCFFAIGHIVAYMRVFLPRLTGDMISAQTNLFVSLIIALVITALLVLLTVTSFTAIRHAIKPETWKKIQLMAYPFFALVYIHLMFVLLPSALADGVNATISIAVYTVLFFSYMVLRTRKAMVTSRSMQPVLSDGKRNAER